jgi:hypothetical protein
MTDEERAEVARLKEYAEGLGCTVSTYGVIRALATIREWLDSPAVRKWLDENGGEAQIGFGQARPPINVELTVHLDSEAVYRAAGMEPPK